MILFWLEGKHETDGKVPRERVRSRKRTAGTGRAWLLGVGPQQPQRRRPLRPADGQPGISRGEPVHGDPAELSRRPGSAARRRPDFTLTPGAEYN